MVEIYVPVEKYGRKVYFRQNSKSFTHEHKTARVCVFEYGDDDDEDGDDDVYGYEHRKMNIYTRTISSKSVLLHVCRVYIWGKIVVNFSQRFFK